MSAKDVLIIGAGLAGIAAAWTLKRRGWDVLVLDSADGPAEGASHANAGALTPSEPEPWNMPGVGRTLLASLFDPQAAMKLRLAPLPGLAAWGLRFLRNSTPKRHAAASRANFALARYSLDRTRAVREELGVECDQLARGTLKVCRTQDGLTRALQAAMALEDHGLEFSAFTAADAVAQEPMLAAVEREIAGAVYFPRDESGDARAFAAALAQTAQAEGVEFEWNARVTGLRDRAGRIVGIDIVTEKQGEPYHESIEADAVVLAAGHSSWRLMKPHGLHLPVRPVKGYSVTLDMSRCTRRPQTPVVDDSLHAIATPLGDRLRLAGTAEIAGEDARIRPERIANLFTLLEAMYPELHAELKDQAPNAWAGFRPMSADGRPFIGETRAEGLWLACGYGHLGWTMAMGAADVLADQMAGEAPAVDAAAFDARRV